MDRPTIDFNDPEFLDVYFGCLAGLKRVLRTEHELYMYTASGHGAWEATLANTLSPGDFVLVLESGWFSEGWSGMAERLGLRVQVVPAEWRRGPDPAAVEQALRDDAGHPAMLFVDTILSLDSLEFRMDDWGIDAVVSGSQKGLMLNTGFSFTAADPKALAAHGTATLPRFYWDWTEMLKRPQRNFVGTIPVSLFYGLRANGVPHGRGGVEAAIDWLADVPA